MNRYTLVLAWTLASLLAATPAMADQAPAGEATTLSLQQRVYTASRIYAAVKMYFAHWETLDPTAFDAAYRNYLEGLAGSDERADFDRATYRFVASLHNAHSWFNDPWFRQHQGGPLGFRARWINKQWAVTESRLENLHPGEVVKSIDGKPVESLFADRRVYLNASSERQARHKFFAWRWLFPSKFTLTLADGRELDVDRDANRKLPASAAKATSGRWLEQGKTAYIAIPSFADPKFETKALEQVKRFSQAQSLIIDVRGNGGGSTPEKLLKALMTRSYRSWLESTPMHIGIIEASAALPDAIRQLNVGLKLSAEEKAYFSAFQTFRNMQATFGPGIEQPDNPMFTGRVFILTDGGCASACEDFVLPFKDNGRATIVGQNTYGSTGQPFILPLGDGMTVSIGAKREYFPDGRPFEGIGIAPDIQVETSLQDLRAGKDPELQAAIQAIHKTPSR
ncbi:MAG: S41 family peptidase [Gammaproteobacteria bacterium]|jgi:carboxyl-terminal processing protease